MTNGIGPRWRKVLRDLGGSKARTALVVLSIAVGVLAVGTIVTTRTILNHDLAAAYLASNPASAALIPNRAFDADLVRLAGHVEGVAAAAGVRGATVQVKVGPNDWRPLRLTGRGDYDDLRLNKLDLMRGNWPPQRREIAIERNSLLMLRADLGDTLVVEVPDGKQFDLRLGTVVHDIGAPPSVFTGQVYGYVTLETMEWLHLPRTFGQLNILVAEPSLDKPHILAVADAVKRKVEQGNVSVAQVFVPNPGEHPANDVLQPLLLILAALGSFSIFLSGFLVVNTVTALLTQQVPQIGMMKAIGARTGQLAGMYLATVLAYGGLAFAVAAPVAAVAGYALTAWLAGLLNLDLQGFRAPPEALAVEAAIALFVPLLAALWPIAGGTRITVREALSSAGIGQVRTHQWAPAFPLSFISRPVLLSLRNTFRRKARLALTLATLTLGGAIFVGVLSLQVSLDKTLDASLAYWQYDAEINFAQGYRIDRLVDEAKQVPGVVAAESWITLGFQRLRPDGHDGPTIAAFGVPPDTAIIHPAIVAGRWLRPEDEDAIVLNSAAAKLEPDLKVGDEVDFKWGKKLTTWRVVGIVKATMTGPSAYAALPAIGHVSQSQGRANQVQVVTTDHAPAAQAATALALKDRFVAGGLRVSRTQTIAGIREGVERQFHILIVLLAMMAVLMAVVGGLGLMGTMGINVLERSREIGVLRAIGASTGAVLRIVLAEGLLIGALSWIAGTALSLPIGKLMADAIGRSLINSDLYFHFSASGALLWLGLVLALAALACLLPALRAARITVREVLTYE